MVVIPVIGLGAFIEPFLYVRMTVGKIKPTGPVVVTGGEIDDLPAPGRDRVESVHLRNKIAVVDAVVPFIEQDEGLGRRWRGHVADLFYDRVSGCPWCDPPGAEFIIAEPIVHRHGAHMRIALASDGAH